MENSNIISKVSNYYTAKIEEYGSASNGVDWNSIESHYERFEQLTEFIKDTSFSILDFGCGYGELINFLNRKNEIKFDYLGFDISKAMISAAEENFKNYRFTSDLNSITSIKDYVIANGIFNVKLDTSNEDWTKYILKTLDELNKFSIKGFSFNILTSYSDKEYMKDYLYYADPLYFFDICKSKYSKYVSLIHDYPLYEFTIVVKK